MKTLISARILIQVGSNCLIYIDESNVNGCQMRLMHVTATAFLNSRLGLFNQIWHAANALEWRGPYWIAGTKLYKTLDSFKEAKLCLK